MHRRKDPAHAIRRRARAWLAPGHHDPATAGGPASLQQPEAVVAWATRGLLRAESAEDVARVVAHVVDRLGGSVIPARQAGTVETLPLDVSFGVSEPMLPTALPGSPAWRALERHLPTLVADARRANDTILRATHLAADVATDPLTGLDTRATFSRELQRLREHDAVVVARITVPEPLDGADDELIAAVCDFSTFVQHRLGPGEHASRIEEDEFGLLLYAMGAAGTAVVATRLRRDWARTHPDVTLDVGAAPFHTDGTTTLRAAYDALDQSLDDVSSDASMDGAASGGVERSPS